MEGSALDAASVLPALPAVGQPWDTIEAVAAVMAAVGVIWKGPGVLWRHVIVPVAGAVNQVDAVTRITPALIALAEVAPALIALSKLAARIESIVAKAETDHETLARLEAKSERRRPDPPRYSGLERRAQP